MAEAAGQRPVLNSLAKIVHDLSDENVSHLRSGQIDIVIDSNPLKQLVLAVDFLVGWHQGSTSLKANLIDFDIFTAGNIPADYPEIQSEE
jgi:ABC-type sugar transport system substrate-binding protein